MKDKTYYRTRLDEIDSRIVDLLSERMSTVSEFAAFKKENGIPVYDPSREREKIAHLISIAPDGVKEFIPAFFSTVFDASKLCQNRISGTSGDLAADIAEAVKSSPKYLPDFAPVACQGTEGAYSQVACNRLFRNANTFFFSDFESVFKAIEKGLCKYGIIPVENSTAGSVNEVYDLMMKHRFCVVKSIRQKIDHCLLVKPGTELKDIKSVYSHEQALAQCSEFFKSNPEIKAVPCANTAVAAKTVAQSDDGSAAAIASRNCSALYGLETVKDSIQNNDSNYTRFICISKDLQILPGADRTSLMVTLSHEQGSLFRFLSHLNALGINLLKLESRPLPNRNFEFMFYFDMEISVYSPSFAGLLSELPYSCDSYTYLGSYSEVL